MSFAVLGGIGFEYLEHPDEIGIFQTLIENVKENLNWIWNSFSRQDQINFL
jgi:hypothetical protein